MSFDADLAETDRTHSFSEASDPVRE